MRTLPILALTIAVIGCSSHHEGLEGLDELYINCENGKEGEPVVSDESYASLVEAEAASKVKPDACRAPELKMPAGGGMLARNTPPMIVFGQMPAACSAATEPSVPFRRSPRKASFLTRAAAWLRPIGVAHAHCAAVSGENYWLRITADGETKPAYAALLSVTTFTPNAETWKKAMASRAGKKVNMTIQRAVFVKGDIMEGPFTQTTPYTFTLSP